eukprot:GEMP01014523.1.p1 GENE.GEMP01014523.1~~GEMP01014523.1.p1  ORF type:complete len:749 (+),score=176.46 GEMP01014523.1:220-2466(+)
MPVARQSRPLSLPQCLDTLDQQYSMMVHNVQKENTSLQELVVALSKEYLLLLSDFNVEERVISMASDVTDVAQSVIEDLRGWFHHQQHTLDEMKNGILRSSTCQVPSWASSKQFNPYDRSPQAQKLLKRRIATLVKQNQRLKKENWDLCGLLSDIMPRRNDATRAKAADSDKDVHDDDVPGSQDAVVVGTAVPQVDPEELAGDDREVSSPLSRQVFDDREVFSPLSRQVFDNSPLFSARVVNDAKGSAKAGSSAVDVLRFTRNRKEGNGSAQQPQQNFASRRVIKGKTAGRSSAKGTTARRSPNNGKPPKPSPQCPDARLLAMTERKVIVRPKKRAEQPKPWRSSEASSRSSTGAASSEGKTRLENKLRPTPSTTPSARLTTSRSEGENVAAGPIIEQESALSRHANTQAAETPPHSGAFEAVHPAVRNDETAADALGVSTAYGEDDAAMSHLRAHIHGFVDEYANVDTPRKMPFQRLATDYLRSTTRAGLSVTTSTAPSNEIVSLSARTDDGAPVYTDVDHNTALRGESRPSDADVADRHGSELSTGADDERKFDELMARTRKHILRTQTLDRTFSSVMSPDTQLPPSTMRALEKIISDSLVEHSAKGVDTPATTVDTITPSSSLRQLVTVGAGHADVRHLPNTATMKGRVRAGSWVGNMEGAQNQGDAGGTWRPIGDVAGVARRKDGLQRKVGGTATKLLDIALDNVAEKTSGDQRADGTLFDRQKDPTQMTRTLFSTLFKKFSID